MTLPQISLREIFLLVALIGMGLGWWARERQLAERVQMAEKRTSEAELEAFYYAQSASMAGLKLPPMNRDDTVLGERNPFVRK